MARPYTVACNGKVAYFKHGPNAYKRWKGLKASGLLCTIGNRKTGKFIHSQW
jgi:hypothetical protein